MPDVTTRITFQVGEHIPAGYAAILRGGRFSTIGPLAEALEHYRPGDIIVVNPGLYDEIRAKFARDVTPPKAG